jgi:hypothetical protein
MKEILVWSLAIPALLLAEFALQGPSAVRAKRKDQIQIGTDLALGMDEADVRKALSARYDLRKVEIDNSGKVNWLVSDRDNPPHVAGVLTFRDGKLLFATKRWLQRDEDRQKGLQTARAVYGVLSAFADHGEASCTVSAEQKESPDLSAKTASVRCGRKSLELLISARPGEDETVEVNESLH